MLLMLLEAPQSAVIDTYIATAWPKHNTQPEHVRAAAPTNLINSVNISFDFVQTYSRVTPLKDKALQPFVGFPAGRPIKKIHVHLCFYAALKRCI